VWVVKLDLPRGVTDPPDLFERASVGSVPDWLLLGGVAIGYALLLAFALTTRLSLSGVDPQTEHLHSQDRD
jgi:uncharacterized membrane protein